MPQDLDKNILALTKAIRDTETGGNYTIKGKSGEYGAYQYTKDTWDGASKKFGVNAQWDKATPAQQNQVTYKRIESWKNAGYNPNQIASMWNAGEGRPNAYKENFKGVNDYGVKYDVPDYVSKVQKAYASRTPKAPPQEAPEAEKVTFGGVVKDIVSPVTTMMARPFQALQSAGQLAQADIEGKTQRTEASSANIEQLRQDYIKLRDSGQDTTQVRQRLGRALSGAQGKIGALTEASSYQPFSTGGLIKEAPQNFGDVKKDVGRGIQTAAFGLKSVAGGALFGTGMSLEQGNKLFGWETLAHTVGGAALGKAADIIGKPLFNVAGKVVGKITPQNLQIAAAGGLKTVEAFMKQNKLLPDVASKAINTGAEALERGANAPFDKAGSLIRKTDDQVIKNREKKLDELNQKNTSSLGRLAEENPGVTGRVSKSNVFAEEGMINKEGKIVGATDASNTFGKQEIKSADKAIRKLLEREGAEVHIEVLRREMRRTASESIEEAGALKAALKNVEKEIIALREANPSGKVRLGKLHKSKIEIYEKVYGKFRTPGKHTVKRARARAYKETIEKYSKENVANINKELEQLYKDKAYIKALQGKVVGHGKLGSMVRTGIASATGAVTGGAVGGIGGAIVGGLAAKEVSQRLAGRAAKKAFGRATGIKPPKNKVLSDAISKAGAKVKDPSVIALGPPETGVKKPVAKTKKPEAKKPEVKKPEAKKPEVKKESSTEFVKAQTTYKHGTNFADEIEKSGFSVRKTEDINNALLGEGIYLDKTGGSGAKLFGKDVIDVFIPSNLNLKKVNNIQELYTKETGFGKPSLITETLKKQGFDGVEASNQIVIFDPSKIKTKTQLTTQFNEANKKGLKKKPSIISRLKKRIKDTPNKQGGFLKIGGLSESKAKSLSSTNNTTDLDKIAKKFKTADEFYKHYIGSATQYNDYTPELRLGGTEGGVRITKLGIDPEETVTIYRGIDDVTGKIKKQINDGDFVTTDFDSAASYSGAKNVVSRDVKAKDLILEDQAADFKEDPFFIGAEYIYSTKYDAKPPLTKSQLTDIWNKANKKEANLPAGKTADDLPQILRGTKGLTAEDITKTHPNIKLTKDVPAKDIHGNKVVIPDGEKLTPYELKGNKVLLQDGETYIVSKNQFDNIKGQSVSAEGKPFAPELEGLEETVRGGGNATIKSNDQQQALKAFESEKKIFGIDENGRKIELYDSTEIGNYDNFEIHKGNIKDTTKFSQYQLPDGENYREMLIKAPTSKEAKISYNLEEYEKFPTEVTKVFEKAGDDSEMAIKGLEKLGYTVDYDPLSFDVYGFYKSTKEAPIFKSSHWDEPNVISHLRINDRTYKGKKVSFMEELQSDWAREGRDKGFSTIENKGTFIRKDGVEYELIKDGEVVDRLVASSPDKLIKRAKDLYGIEKDITIVNDSGIPSHPLVVGNKWQEPTIKRALKDAVDNDAKYFAWINGEQTSARYNLATQVDNVKWDKNKPFEGENLPDKFVIIKPKDGGTNITIGLNRDGSIKSSSKGDWQGKKLDEVLGKGLADSIMAKETGTLSGDGLKFGGEWANNLYDKQVKSIVKDLTGAKVIDMDMGLPIEKKGDLGFMNFEGGRMTTLLKPSEITKSSVGKTLVSKDGTPYIITNVLGDGKFKAVPKNKVFTKADYLSKDLGYKELGDKVYKNSDMEQFDISVKNTTQQGIELTPEVIAKIRGEAPVIKTSGKQFETALPKRNLVPESSLNRDTTGATNVLGAIKTPEVSLPRNTDLATEAKNFNTADEFIKATGKREPFEFSDLPRTVKEDLSTELYDTLKPEHNFVARFGAEDILSGLEGIKIQKGLENVDNLIAQFGLQNRKTSPLAVKNLIATAKKVGDLDPILVNGRELIDGGHRLMAYKALGRKEIPVIDISNIYKELKENPAIILDPYEFGLKSFEKPKSQLTDIWNKANKKETKAKAKDVFDKKLAGIKDSKDILRRRRNFVSDLRDRFGLTDSELRKINRRDIRLMDNYEFKKFIDGMEQKAVELADTRQAKAELVDLINAKEFRKVENYRKAMELPSVSEMSPAQLRQYAEALEKFQVGDEFLTTRTIQTIDRTDLSGVRTIREIKENLLKEVEKATGQKLTIEDLEKYAKVPSFARFTYDTALAEKNPFWKYTVQRVQEKIIGGQANSLIIKNEVDKLAKAAEKSRNRGVLGSVRQFAVPKHEEIIKYLEAPVDQKSDYLKFLTKEEIDYANYVDKYYSDAYDHLVSIKELQGSRFVDQYFTHTRKTFLEKWSDDGLLSAFKNMFEAQKDDAIVANIIDQDTGKILTKSKFFANTLYRSGELDPSQNLTRVFNQYASMFERKKMFDNMIPEIDAYTQSLTPKNLTPKGLEMDRTLKTFMNEYLNNKKGRKANFQGVLPQNGALDIGLRMSNTLVSLRDLGLNVGANVASLIGEQMTTYQGLGKVDFAKGWKRRLWDTGIKRLKDKDANKILKEAEPFLGRNIWTEMAEANQQFGDRALQGIFGIFSQSSVEANKIFLLGSLTDAELKSGKISVKRMAELRLEAGRWRDMGRDVKSIVGSTSFGASATKYKGWAIPILRTNINNLTKISQMVKAKQFKEAMTSKEIKETYRAIEMSTVLVVLGSYIISEDEDDSFVGKMKARAYQEAMTLLGGVDPTLFLAAPRNASFALAMAENLKKIAQWEQYEQDSRWGEEGDLKGFNGLLRQLTPSAIRQFAPSTKEEESSGGLALPKIKGTLPSSGGLPKLPKLGS